MHWVERRLSWRAKGMSRPVAKDGNFCNSSDVRTDCSGSGSLDLGPADALGAITEEQEKRLRIPCTHRHQTPPPHAPLPMTGPHFDPPQVIKGPGIVGWTDTGPPLSQWNYGCSHRTEKVVPVGVRADATFLEPGVYGRRRHRFVVSRELSDRYQIGALPEGRRLQLMIQAAKRVILREIDEIFEEPEEGLDSVRPLTATDLG